MEGKDNYITLSKMYEPIKQAIANIPNTKVWGGGEL